MAETLIAQVVGYGTRMKTVPHMGGSISPPVGDMRRSKPNPLRLSKPPETPGTTSGPQKEWETPMRSWVLVSTWV